MKLGVAKLVLAHERIEASEGTDLARLRRKLPTERR